MPSDVQLGMSHPRYTKTHLYSLKSPFSLYLTSLQLLIPLSTPLFFTKLQHFWGYPWPSSHLVSLISYWPKADSLCEQYLFWPFYSDVMRPTGFCVGPNSLCSLCYSGIRHPSSIIPSLKSCRWHSTASISTYHWVWTTYFKNSRLHHRPQNMDDS